MKANESKKSKNESENLENESKIKSRDIKFVDVKKLTDHPKNANRHSKEQIKRLAQLIEFQGFRIPIIVSKFSGHIVSGHCRLEAAKKLGMKQVPVIYQDFENEAQEYAFLISDNEISRWGELDIQSLKLELPNFDLDFDLLGLKNVTVAQEIPKGDSGDCEDEQEDKPKKVSLKVDLPDQIEMQLLYERLISEGYMVTII